MTDTTPVSPEPAGGSRWRWLPELRSRWWTVLLGASLMVNLLIGGLMLGHRFGPGGRMERMSGASYVQLIPRQFFADLPRDRRGEFLKIIRDKGKDLRGLRDHSSATALKLAEALEKDNYNLADTKSAVDAFATGSESLAVGGGAVVLEIVALLTPDERKLLAQSIRDRADNQNRRKRK